jgi:hypothetical protein
MPRGTSNEWSWIVNAIEAIERCDKARRFAYATVFSATVVCLAYIAGNVLIAWAGLPS